MSPRERAAARLRLMLAARKSRLGMFQEEQRYVHVDILPEFLAPVTERDRFRHREIWAAVRAHEASHAGFVKSPGNCVAAARRRLVV